VGEVGEGAWEKGGGIFSSAHTLCCVCCQRGETPALVMEAALAASGRGGGGVEVLSRACLDDSLRPYTIADLTDSPLYTKGLQLHIIP